jgi:hypothetical protein
VNIGKGTAAWPLLFDTGGTSGFAQHAALRNEDHMAVRKLLLQFTGESISGRERRTGRIGMKHTSVGPS